MKNDPPIRSRQLNIAGKLNKNQQPAISRAKSYRGPNRTEFLHDCIIRYDDVKTLIIPIGSAGPGDLSAGFLPDPIPFTAVAVELGGYSRTADDGAPYSGTPAGFGAVPSAPNAEARQIEAATLVPQGVAAVNQWNVNWINHRLAYTLPNGEDIVGTQSISFSLDPTPGQNRKLTTFTLENYMVHPTIMLTGQFVQTSPWNSGATEFSDPPGLPPLFITPEGSPLAHVGRSLEYVERDGDEPFTRRTTEKLISSLPALTGDLYSQRWASFPSEFYLAMSGVPIYVPPVRPSALAAKSDLEVPASSFNLVPQASMQPDLIERLPVPTATNISSAERERQLLRQRALFLGHHDAVVDSLQAGMFYERWRRYLMHLGQQTILKRPKFLMSVVVNELERRDTTQGRLAVNGVEEFYRRVAVTYTYNYVPPATEEDPNPQAEIRAETVVGSEHYVTSPHHWIAEARPATMSASELFAANTRAALVQTALSAQLVTIQTLANAYNAGEPYVSQGVRLTSGENLRNAVREYWRLKKELTTENEVANNRFPPQMISTRNSVNITLENMPVDQVTYLFPEMYAHVTRVVDAPGNPYKTYLLNRQARATLVSTNASYESTIAALQGLGGFSSLIDLYRTLIAQNNTAIATKDAELVTIETDAKNAVLNPDTVINFARRPFGVVLTGTAAVGNADIDGNEPFIVTSGVRRYDPRAWAAKNLVAHDGTGLAFGELAPPTYHKDILSRLHDTFGTRALPEPMQYRDLYSPPYPSRSADLRDVSPEFFATYFRDSPLIDIPSNQAPVTLWAWTSTAWQDGDVLTVAPFDFYNPDGVRVGMFSREHVLSLRVSAIFRFQYSDTAQQLVPFEKSPVLILNEPLTVTFPAPIPYEISRLPTNPQTDIRGNCLLGYYRKNAEEDVVWRTNLLKLPAGAALSLMQKLVKDVTKLVVAGDDV